MQRHIHRPLRRRLLNSMAAAGASLALPASGQTAFPKGPVRIIVGLPAGGSADVQARAIAPFLEAALKHPVIVENRPGGQFQVSMQALMSAPADGHTLLYLYNGYTVAQAAHRLFDLDRDTTPVTQMITTPALVMVRAESPYKSLAELVADARKRPGELTYSTFGPDSVEHLLMTRIMKTAGASGAPVPYRGGPDSFKGLLGGEVDCGLFAGIFAKSFLPSGRIRALAVLDARRWSEFPEVPTLGEAGVTLSPFDYWAGVSVRKGTPPEIVSRLFRELHAAGSNADVVAKFMGSAAYPALSASPEAFGQRIRSDLAWARSELRGAAG